MVLRENIHRITKYFAFSVLILFHLCLAQDEIVQTSADGKWHLQLSAPGRPNSLDGTNSSGYQLEISYTDGQYYKTVFFVLLGLGLAVFIGLLFICYKVARTFQGINTPSATGSSLHPSNVQATYNLRAPDGGGITFSYTNSAYSSGPEGRSEVDRPPDYSTVSNTDAINRNVAFPQVVTTHLETPPPKYEDAPVFN